MAGSMGRFTSAQQNRLACSKAEGIEPSAAFLMAIQQLDSRFNASENDAWLPRSFFSIEDNNGRATSTGILHQRTRSGLIQTRVVVTDGKKTLVLRIKRKGYKPIKAVIKSTNAGQIDYWYTPNGKRVTEIIGNPPAVH